MARVSSVVDPNLQLFHDRPFRVSNSHRFVEATREAIRDEGLRSLPLHGSISQCVDSTDILSSGPSAHRFRDVLAGTNSEGRA